MPTVSGFGADGATLLEKFGTVRCADGAKLERLAPAVLTVATAEKSLAPTVPNFRTDGAKLSHRRCQTVLKGLTSSVLNFDTVGALVPYLVLRK